MEFSDSDFEFDLDDYNPVELETEKVCYKSLRFFIIGKFDPPLLQSDYCTVI